MEPFEVIMRDHIIFILISVAIVLLVPLTLVGCGRSDMEAGPSAPDSAAVEGESAPETAATSYSLEEVATHGSEDDCWMAIDGRVYDVTDYIPDHPNLDPILAGCGLEATELYDTRPMGSGTPHSPRADQLLEDYLIGELER